MTMLEYMNSQRVKDAVLLVESMTPDERDTATLKMQLKAAHDRGDSEAVDLIWRVMILKGVIAQLRKHEYVRRESLQSILKNHRQPRRTARNYVTKNVPQ